MSDKTSKLIASSDAHSARIQEAARLLWESGPMQGDWEYGRGPFWAELCGMPEHYLSERLTTEEHARHLLSMSDDDWNALAALRAIAKESET